RLTDCAVGFLRFVLPEQGVEEVVRLDVVAELLLERPLHLDAAELVPPLALGVDGLLRRRPERARRGPAAALARHRPGPGREELRVELRGGAGGEAEPAEPLLAGVRRADEQGQFGVAEFAQARPDVPIDRLIGDFLPRSEVRRDAARPDPLVEGRGVQRDHPTVAIADDADRQLVARGEPVHPGEYLLYLETGERAAHLVGPAVDELALPDATCLPPPP